MLLLKDYRAVPDRLSDFIVWHALITPSVMLNKDGSLQRTFQFRGPDLASSTEQELVIACAQLNNTLMQLGSRWALHIEANRYPATDYPLCGFPDQVSFLFDAERRGAFKDGVHLQSDYFITFIYLPLSDKAKRAGAAFFEQAEPQQNDDDPFSRRDDLRHFLKTTGDIYRLLARTMYSVTVLEGEACLTYLHSTISLKRQPVALPDPPVFLDAYLVDTPLLGGLAPKLGDYHLRVLTFRYFPSQSQPALLDELNQLGIEYRWTSRFITLDKAAAVKELDKLQKNWFKKQKSFLQVVMEALTREPSPLINTDAVNKATEADAALQAVQADLVAYGYYTGTVMVWDQDGGQADQKRDQLQAVVHSQGITTVAETVNAVEAFLGSLPGHCAANMRYPLISTLNLIHLLPYSAVWAGEPYNAHLQAPALMLTSSGGSTPFWFNLHQGDVGHTLVLGPTGAGKSTLLWTLAIQFLRYPGAQVFAFDKGRSGLVTTCLVGGHHYELGTAEGDSRGGLAFQPLAGIDQPAEHRWAYEWLLLVVAAEGVVLNPNRKAAISAALTTLAGYEPRLRTLTGFVGVVQDQDIRKALVPYTLDGEFGYLLDADQDTLATGRWLCFEMDALMAKRQVVLPVLDYLFHKLEQRFTGAPTLLLLDEAWLFLAHEAFARKIQTWLKVLRRANVAVVFASQELDDAANSPIFPTLMSNCLTRIYLPNKSALNEQTRPIYQSFGLNHQQIRLIATATPKRHYYYTCPTGNRLLELELGEVGLQTVAASRKGADLPLMTQLQTQCPRDPEKLAAAWYRHRGLEWAANLIEQQAFVSQPATTRAVSEEADGG